jgi:hypothetical protein
VFQFEIVFQVEPVPGRAKGLWIRGTWLQDSARPRVRERVGDIQTDPITTLTVTTPGPGPGPGVPTAPRSGLAWPHLGGSVEP